MNAKEWFITAFVNRFVRVANNNMNIAELQKKHHAYASKVVRLSITDANKHYHFRVTDGRLEYVEKPAQVDGGIEITTDALVALVKRKLSWMDPATGETVEKPFTPIHAVQMGWVRYWGQAASNDVLLLSREIYREVLPAMQEQLQLSEEQAATVVGKNGVKHA